MALLTRECFWRQHTLESERKQVRTNKENLHLCATSKGREGTGCYKNLKIQDNPHKSSPPKKSRHKNEGELPAQGQAATWKSSLHYTIHQVSLLGAGQLEREIFQDLFQSFFQTFNPRRRVAGWKQHKEERKTGQSALPGHILMSMESLRPG